MTDSDSIKTIGTPTSPGTTEFLSPGPLPGQIGRYSVERELGHGGFGRVYLARDDQLDRRVAVKVPHAYLVDRPTFAELYLREARMVANLEHPHIVPVFDVGTTAEFPFFIVSKYISGGSLAAHVKLPLEFGQSVELIAILAETLHYAHTKGIVHRDVKPGNILI
ncbi:MAG TPA: serine/threonine-protein kinase, partial [Pirellulaceae bacterium]